MGVSLEDLLKENSDPILEDKSKKTINLLLVIIAIVAVIILLLVVLAISNAKKREQIERAQKLATDIDLISTHIKNVYSQYRIDGDSSKLIGLSLENDRGPNGETVEPIVLYVNGNREEYKHGYYYVTAEQINQMVTTLQIKNEDYVLNYSTGDAINLVGAKSNGRSYYNVDDLRAIALGQTPPSDYTIYIHSAEDMEKLRQYPNGYFKLEADIDMSYYSTGDGWDPVDEFYGKIDGRGYVIRNLVVSRASDRYCGLFGQVKNGASINNLKLENVNISGGEYTGSIAGTCSGNVSNCTVNGTVSSQSSNVGGVFGLYENGVAQNIVANVSVNGTENIGGFVGTLTSGTVEQCSETGSVTGMNKVGGFAGRVAPLALTTVSQVSSDCTIIATENAGGFVGSLEVQNASQINLLNSYAKGQISTCTRTAGGFVGNISTVSTATLNFVSLYTVVDTPILCEVRGGFAGNISASGASSTVSNCFWEKDNVNDGDLDGTARTNNTAITFESHSPAEMRVIATFGKWDMQIWKFVEGGTPVLNWQ